jgi:hypothetical protein
MEKKPAGKVEAEFLTSSILKKNSIKIILKKNMWGNIVTIHSVLKKKLRSKIDKIYSCYFQPAQY